MTKSTSKKSNAKKPAAPMGLTVKAYRGDAKTLLAFNLPKAKTTNLAGFTVQIKPPGLDPYYLLNQLRFEDQSKHAQDQKLPPNSSFNAPIHKFRWVHVPGLVHQSLQPSFGQYTYTVTPRYFDGNRSLLPIDTTLSVSAKVEVGPFVKGAVQVCFTRGFVQSQAFVNHFGPKAKFRPAGGELLFNTSEVSGTDNQGKKYSFADQYDWLGFTARRRIFEIANLVLENKNLTLDVFAYDLNEPDLLKIFLQLAKQGRMRIILDNAALHHDKAKPKPEDEFETLFSKAAKKPAEIMRGKFGRYAHDKVFLVSDSKGPKLVLTGSTNFSVTGMYVNSNHIIVFDDRAVAAKYAEVFAAVWRLKVSKTFTGDPLAGQSFNFTATGVPSTDIAFSPHSPAEALKNLQAMEARITTEGKTKNGSVLFAVMGLDKATGPVLPALQKLNANQTIFSYGISDSPGGIQLYTRRKKTGVLVSGKPKKSQLPPPFNQVPQIGLGHQIHHKFVVCGFNGPDAVVYCGSSNLAEGGEENNGDNLLAIHDQDIATVFAIDALALVDHFDFLDRSAATAGTTPEKVKKATKQDQAVQAGWFLGTTDKWVGPYYDKNDLHYVDRELFGA
jgi:phosphatidylserine/phosphatidylglycerophosphate/cardiolipin synthase-like enzyme